jgi:beta-glucosidase
MQDSPVGVRFADFVSVWPAGVNAAATWSRSIANQRGAGMGYEHRNKGVDVQLGPVAGPLGRAPEGGRNWEGFSPDPYLTGQLMAETVSGIQSEGVIACAKHYIGNEQEHFRQAPQAPFNITESISSNIDDKTLHEVYLWPFADAVHANVGSIMCSYNQVNNSYACQNSYLLNHVLKGELGFQGFIMSDWSAQHSGVASALAGLDMTMPGDVGFDSGTSYWGTNETVAVLNGTLPQWRLDDQVVRILAAWYYVGRDTRAVPINFDSWTDDTYGFANFYADKGYGLINEHVDVRNGHQQLTRQIAGMSTVLLKNTNKALPLTGREKLTGIFGEDAGSNVWGENGCPDHGCDNGTLGMAWGSGTASFASLITPQMAIITELVANGAAVESILDNWAYQQIGVLAGRVDTAIVFVNSDSGEGYINVDGNVGDRRNLTLWRNGDTLIQNVTAMCNNTIVVVHSTGPVVLEQYAHNPNVSAILWAGVPGDMSGYAIADVLYGRVNPGGKLPFTIGKRRQDYGTDLLYVPPPGEETGTVQQNFVEGPYIDYRHFDAANISPTYEFGYGQSYTTFQYSNLQITNLHPRQYKPNTQGLPTAPTYGTIDNHTADYVFPSNISRVPYYVYPYLNSTNLKKSTNDTSYGTDPHFPANARNSSAQPAIAAGGGSGGNPQLWDEAFRVTATITNTGSVPGDEIAQLYLSFGGPYDPPRVLRGFDRLTIQPGQSETFTATLLRRDVSSWDSASQNWVQASSGSATVYVGGSSRILPLQAKLQ